MYNWLFFNFDHLLRWNSHCNHRCRQWSQPREVMPHLRGSLCIREACLEVNPADGPVRSLRPRDWIFRLMSHKRCFGTWTVLMHKSLALKGRSYSLDSGVISGHMPLLIFPVRQMMWVRGKGGEEGSELTRMKKSYFYLKLMLSPQGLITLTTKEHAQRQKPHQWILKPSLETTIAGALSTPALGALVVWPSAGKSPEIRNLPPPRPAPSQWTPHSAF